MQPRLLFLILGVVLSATACGGDDGGMVDGDGGIVTIDASGPTSDADIIAPTLVSSSPAHEAVDVVLDTIVVATFSEPLAPASVTASSFSVIDDTGTTITGELTVDGAAITFTPDAPLRLDRTYTTTVTTAVTDRSGNGLATEASFDFGTHLRTWSTATPIDASVSASAAQPRLGCSADGSAVVAWLLPGDAGSNVHASRYVSATGWATPVPLDTEFATADTPDVAMSDTGDAVVAWSQPAAGSDSIWAAKLSGTSGTWATATTTESNVSTALRPRVAMGGTGTTFAVWPEFDTLRWNAWRSIDSGSGWTASALESVDSKADDPVVAADATGNAIALWTQRIGGTNLFASSYADATWTTPEPLGISTATREIHVAMTPSGDAVAVWKQLSQSVASIWSARYQAGTWTTPEALETDINHTDVPRVAVATDGNAVAVWTQSDGVRTNIWANRYVAGTGWAGAELIETIDTGNAETPDVAIDSDGNAMVVWSQVDTVIRSIWLVRFTPGANWGTPILLETDDTGHATEPKICFGRGDSVGTVSWLQTLGGFARVVTTRFE